MGVFAPLATPVLVQGAPGTLKDVAVRAMHEAGSSGHGELAELEAGAFEPEDVQPGATAVHLRSVERLSREGQEFWVREIADPDGYRLFASTEAVLDSHHLSSELHSALTSFTVELPLLDDHLEDLRDVLDAALRRVSRELGRSNLAVDSEVRSKIESARWPGNELELIDVIRRSAILSPGRIIGFGSLSQAQDEVVTSVTRIRKLRDSREREQLVSALHASGGVIARASRMMGVNRSAVYRLMDKHGLERARKS